MDRRTFVSLLGSGVLMRTGEAARAGVMDQAETESQNRSTNPVRMHLGTQQGPTTPRMLQYLKRHGVNHICGYPTADAGQRGMERGRPEAHARPLRATWYRAGHGGPAVPVVKPYRSRAARCDHAGAKSRPRSRHRADPSDDRRLRQGGRSGVQIQREPAWSFAERDDAGARRVTLQHLAAGGGREQPPLTRAGKVSADVAWERITYFLDRIIPVCNEYKVRAACHPHDPGVPPAGFQGIVRVLGTLDGLRRFVSIQESPYHGLNLCLGTTAEMLQDPPGDSRHHS